jgi:hypothetical protein
VSYHNQYMILGPLFPFIRRFGRLISLPKHLIKGNGGSTSLLLMKSSCIFYYCDICHSLHATKNHFFLLVLHLYLNMRVLVHDVSFRRPNYVVVKCHAAPFFHGWLMLRFALLHLTFFVWCNCCSKAMELMKTS